MEITIRKATVDDLLAVQKLSQELFTVELPRDPLLNMQWSLSEEGQKIFLARITQENKFCLVATLGQEIVGYAAGSILPVRSERPVKRLELENLLVTEKYRGQKVGEKLAQVVFDLAKSLGMERVMVAAYASNDGAIKFYKRIGFTPDTFELEKEL